MLKAGVGAKLHNGVADTVEAARIIDEAMKDIEIETMFLKLRKKSR